MQAERPCARAFLDAAAAASGGGIWAKMNVAGCEERESGTPETKKAAPSWRARGAHRDRFLNLWPTTQEDRALLRCADLHHCSLRQAFACPVFAIWRSFGRLSNLGHVFPRKKGKAASLGRIVPGRLSIALLDPENGAGAGANQPAFRGASAAEDVCGASEAGRRRWPRAKGRAGCFSVEAARTEVSQRRLVFITRSSSFEGSLSGGALLVLLGSNFAPHCGSSAAMIRIFREFVKNAAGRLWRWQAADPFRLRALFYWLLGRQFRQNRRYCFLIGCGNAARIATIPPGSEPDHSRMTEISRP